MRNSTSGSDAALAARAARSARPRRVVGVGRHARDRRRAGWSRSCPRPAGSAGRALVVGLGQRLGHRRAAAQDRAQRRQVGRPVELRARPSRSSGTPAARVTRSASIRSAMLGRRQARAGDHQRGAGQRGRVGQAPGVGVEHRHDRQHESRSRRPSASAIMHAERVQDGRAVRVDDALGVPGGAARVAHGRGAVLVEIGELEARDRRSATSSS